LFHDKIMADGEANRVTPTGPEAHARQRNPRGSRQKKKKVAEGLKFNPSASSIPSPLSTFLRRLIDQAAYALIVTRFTWLRRAA
jgi:hypothetical protein